MGLMNYLQKALEAFARFQQKYLFVVIAIILGVTAVALVGVMKVRIESDFEKLNPKDLPITSLDLKVSKEFSRTNSIIILVQIDDNIEHSNEAIVDIRDPRVMEFLVRLDKNLREENFVEDVVSIAPIFIQTGVPGTISGVKQILQQVPSSSDAFSSDYSFTVVFVEANIGSSTEHLDAANAKIREIISLSSPPPGIKAIVTGDPALGSALFNLLISDSFHVLIYATIFIFILLIVRELSFKRAVISILPLLFGLCWTVGTLGWMGIPITVGTVGLSAMLLGLGVEYAVFFIERYKEENQMYNVGLSLEKTLGSVGTSIFSSAGTTVIGFFALSFSIFPILSGLGISLGIGITMLLIATFGITPVLINLDHRVMNAFEKKSYKKIKKERAKAFRIFDDYGAFVSRYPVVMFIIALGITGVMFFGIQQIKQSDFNFQTVLPKDMPELQAYTLLQNEFSDTSGAVVYIYLEPSEAVSDEPEDIRDKRVLDYIDLLTQRLSYVDHAIEVSSITKSLRIINNGVLPGTISSNIGLFDAVGERFLTKDYQGSLIRITFDEQGDSDYDEIIRQIKEIISNTEKPAGVEAAIIGELAVVQEQNSIIGSDSSRTSLIALLTIVVFLYLLTFSIRGTILPLTTVIFGIIWTLGLVGFLKIPFTTITSSVVTMTIGIGIDFGLQLFSRFQYELQNREKKEAMRKTISSLLLPMIMTVVAAVIGFRAMAFGKLSLMSDLGNTMSIAIISSMLASIIGVASLILLLQRGKKPDIEEKDKEKPERKAYKGNKL